MSDNGSVDVVERFIEGGGLTVDAKNPSVEITEMNSRLVVSVDSYPGMCCVTHETYDPVGFIDSGSHYTFGNKGGRLYISASWVLRHAFKLGALDPVERTKLVAENDELREDLRVCEEELADLKRVLERIEALESRGFRRTLRTGRPIKLDSSPKTKPAVSEKQ